MTPEYIACAQGSPEWHAARAGLITASMFKVAREKLKSGQPSSAAKKYAFQVAIERISGLPLDDGFETYAMRRGHELEPMARLRHQEAINEVVRTCGVMVVRDDEGAKVYGASADGLINEDGGAEYKCLISPSSLMPVLLEDNIDEYMDQVQGCLWISGRAWWDFCLYCPALGTIQGDLTRLRIHRDDAYIEELVGDLIGFKQLVDSYEATLRSRGAAQRLAA